MASKKKGNQSAAAVAPASRGFYRQTPEGVILNVRACPRSSRAGVDALIADEALKVRIRAAPVDGKANSELIETLADAFHLAKSAVVFKGGETSKTKRILLRGITGEAFMSLMSALRLE